MAKYLYRLGKFSFRKKWWFLTAWLVILGLTIGAASAFGGTLSNSFSVPGTESQETLDNLQRDLPDYTGGSGTVVFSTKDKKAFTTAEKEKIGKLLGKSDNSKDSGVSSIDGVNDATNPFAVQAKLKQAEKQLSAGKTQAQQGQQQLDQMKQQLRNAGVKEFPPELKEQEKKLTEGNSSLDIMTRYLDSAQGVKMVSDNNQVALSNITLSTPVPEVSTQTREDLAEYFESAAADPKMSNVDIELSQQLTLEQPEMFGPGEVVGLIVAAIVLFVMLGTLVAMGLPLIQALLGVGIGVGGTFALSGVIDMSSVSTTLALMLGLAVGIDYSLFITTRYRRELENGHIPVEAAGRALGTSGSAVFFAGLTVIIALAALVVPNIPFLSIMGLSGAFTVLVAVLIALMLTSAMFGFAGKYIVPKKIRTRLETFERNPEAVKGSKKKEAIAENQAPRGYLKVLSKASGFILVLGVVILGVVAIPAGSLHLGLPGGLQENQGSSAYKSTKIINDNFGDGYNATIISAVEFPKKADHYTQEEVATKALNIADEYKKVANVDDAVPAVQLTPNSLKKKPDTNIVLIQVIPHGGSADESTENVVKDIRDTNESITANTGDTFGVTGMTAMNIDMSQKLADAMPQYLFIVIGLSLVLLLLVFRSIILPLLATGGFLLSLAASFGATVAVYQWGWLSGIFGVHDPGPVLSFLPIILVGVLFGLAMDYQVFLGTAMREAYVHGPQTQAGAKRAVLIGFQHSRRVVTAAAIIMIAVFAGFIFNDMPMIRPIGFALAFGVFVDAFVVRMGVVPAAMYLIGKPVWWLPEWLQRILPDIDVEGAKLDEFTPKTKDSDEVMVPAG